jgi:rubrerythrin
MRQRASVVLVVLGLLVAAAPGCKKTVEGENKAWTANVAEVGRLKALYPGFAAALSAQQVKAEESMASARGLSSPEQAAKAMGEANDLLAGRSFVGTLRSLDGQQKQLRDAIIEANRIATTPGDQASARVAADDAQRVLRNVDDALRMGAPTPEAATALCRKMSEDLTSAKASLDKIAQAAKAAQKSAQAEAQKAAAEGASGATPAAPAQWKCAYCKGMVDGAKTTCPHCGAPKSGGAAHPVSAKPGMVKPGAAQPLKK